MLDCFSSKYFKTDTCKIITNLYMQNNNQLDCLKVPESVLFFVSQVNIIPNLRSNPLLANYSTKAAPLVYFRGVLVKSERGANGGKLLLCCSKVASRAAAIVRLASPRLSVARHPFLFVLHTNFLKAYI